MADNERDTFKIPIGPQHPALKEPGHFEFSVDGEIVTGASLRLGYVHRGIEKGVEARNWIQGQYLVERVCGICSHVHATAYSLAVERLAGKVRVWHVKNVKRVYFPEVQRAVFLHAALDEGDIDYRWALGRLAESGFDGYIALEGAGPGDLLAFAARSKAYLDGLCRERGGGGDLRVQ